MGSVASNSGAHACMASASPAAPPPHLEAVICVFIYSFFLSLFVDGSVSWVSAEKLWILGRYMVHLSFEEIMNISPIEVSWKKYIFMSLLLIYLE